MNQRCLALFIVDHINKESPERLTNHTAMCKIGYCGISVCETARYRTASVQEKVGVEVENVNVFCLVQEK